MTIRATVAVLEENCLKVMVQVRVCFVFISSENAC